MRVEEGVSVRSVVCGWLGGRINGWEIIPGEQMISGAVIK